MGFRSAFVLVLCLLLTATVRAQGPFNEAGPLGMPVPLRSFAGYCRTLGFDAEQSAAARELHRGYSAAYREATVRATKEAEPLTDRPSRMLRADKYVDEIKALERQLLADLRALCSNEQAARFASVERARRRDAGRLLAFSAGDGIDLVKMLETLKVQRSPGADEILARWEQNLDRVEADRERLVRGIMKVLAEQAQDPEDMKPIQTFVLDLQAISVRARDATRRTVRELDGVLSEEARSALAAEFKRQCYPRIYADSDAVRALEAAVKLPDLIPEQRERVAQLAAGYHRDSGPINDRWALAVDEKQADLAKDLEKNSMPDDPQDPFLAARTERLALDDRTSQRLADILTKEQLEKLPKPSRRNNDLPEFMPDLGNSYADDWEEFEVED